MRDSVTNQAFHSIRTQFMAKGIVSATNCYISSAKGAIIVDVEGKEYIDFAGGIAVMNVGHSQSLWGRSLWGRTLDYNLT